MSQQPYSSEHTGSAKRPFRYFCAFLLLAMPTLLFTGCGELEKPNTNAFYAATEPPRRQEFRWSNGKTPKSFDPALASAPPETDIVRAIYEGLTELDSRTLKAIPGVAEKWSGSDDLKIWTFQIRKDAKWSNGKHVTAHDFVRSWKRLAVMGEAIPHRGLLANIEGIGRGGSVPAAPPGSTDFFSTGPASPAVPLNERSRPGAQVEDQNAAIRKQEPEDGVPAEGNTGRETDKKPVEEIHLGVEAVDDFVLRVRLTVPDPDFPSLVAHPIFRPVFGNGDEFAKKPLSVDIVTNGAFRIAGIGQDGITLDRADYYWNRSAVKLERVRFVPMDSAEKALEAYRSGQIDAVTNADFEPLALKLLTPFKDFRQTTHAALNFYEFNLAKPPFNDRRVREALAIAIERERLTEGEMKGSTQPAMNFLPFAGDLDHKFTQDVERAKELLENAGFPDGENFPTIRLLINRNDTQQRIARSVAKMWKQNLNLDTEIVVKELVELEAERASGQYDLVRRGLVFPTTDVAANLMSIFGPENLLFAKGNSNDTEGTPLEKNTPAGKRRENETHGPAGSIDQDGERSAELQGFVLTEEAAVFEIRAIPLYFPTSYSLIKPYVQGFEINSLDAPLLKDVVIDSGWQPRLPKSES